ncbi:MAG TPA: polyribonucleotide nucleotidyltransferase, partial [Candidatus Acidoferrales bacterium]|nr:polyribonucleotide nucleotidyltransferase [Candidatus Acidoferrales bacterium]
MHHTVSVDIGGRKLTLETGKVAKQANGAIWASYGDTVVLVSACMDSKATEKDFLPLTVDYRENTYSAGKIPGGFFKREGRPSEREILTSRMIDRPLRPLFPEGWNRETQVVAMVLSADSHNDPDMVAITAASAAAFCSDLPFDTPVAAVRIGLIDGQLIVNPSYEELKTSGLNIVIVASDDAIVMVEAGALEASEEKVAEALEFGHAEAKKIVAVIRELHAKLNTRKVEVAPPAFDKALFKEIETKWGARLEDALDTAKHPKKRSYSLVDAIKKEILESIPKEDTERTKLAMRAFERLREQIFRDNVLTKRRRPDARAFDQVRKITCEVGVLPRTHGSALFTRGETQALGTLTLGTKEDMQRLDLLFERDTFKRFLLHYNFPPFSVGEVKFMRGPGRREIGHGALADRSLINMLPTQESFPYAMRVVSDILESNGSSSMATICAGTLAMLDAGVPLKASVAGIAMGLVVEGTNYAILTDIAGAEDHYGDMDFKVAGTRNGITGLQMDIKVSGVTIAMMREALAQARKARLEILDIMEKTISAPRENISQYAPRLFMLQIPVDKIRDLIGPGGKKIRSITETTGAKIDVMDDGRVHVFAADGPAGEEAVRLIREVTATAEIGKTYLGRVS